MSFKYGKRVGIVTQFWNFIYVVGMMHKKLIESYDG